MNKREKLESIISSMNLPEKIFNFPYDASSRKHWECCRFYYKFPILKQSENLFTNTSTIKIRTSEGKWKRIIPRIDTPDDSKTICNEVLKKVQNLIKEQRSAEKEIPYDMTVYHDCNSNANNNQISLMIHK
jgi:hypothetical protein